jgi:hydrogenase-4 component F
MTIAYLISAFCLATGLFINRNKTVNYVLVILFLILQWGFTLYTWTHLRTTENGYFTFDSLGMLLLITLSIIAVPSVIHSKIYIERHAETSASRAIYFGSLVSLITAIGAGYLANHLAVVWIFTEITTLSSSALIYHHRNKLALEGTWKYVFICALSISFVFIGILFLSMSLRHAGSTDLSFKNLLENSKSLNPFWLKLAFLFIFTGFTAKLGLVPMFTAGVDAKDTAPGPAGALLASVLMNLGFIGIFRLYTIVAHTPLHHWANLVIGAAAFLSIFVATAYMIRVKNVKRMFAYSGIEHMGLVMLGIIAGGIGYYAAILHIILHALVKSGLFFQYNQLYRVFQSKSISYIGNYFKYHPTGAMVLLLGFVSAAAMPPSGMFVSEFLIFRSLFEAKQIILLMAVLMLLTMIIWAFGKNIFKILFIPVAGFDERNVPVSYPWECVSQFILMALAIYLGFNPPDALVALIRESVALLP